jgi:septal ring factor EnvC (AmiA/AmiB activator)
MSAIGAVSGSAPASTPAPAGLDARKTQVEKQLADCVSCASSNTPEGQAKISALSTQLAAVEAQMQKADEARAEASKAAQGDSVASSPAAREPDSLVGQNVDVFA